MRYTVVILLCIAHFLHGQHQHHDDFVQVEPPSKSGIEFVQNAGQWEENIQFRANIPSGKLYVESGKLTYLFYDQNDVSRIHDIHHGKKAITLNLI